MEVEGDDDDEQQEGDAGDAGNAGDAGEVLDSVRHLRRSEQEDCRLYALGWRLCFVSSEVRAPARFRPPGRALLSSDRLPTHPRTSAPLPVACYRSCAS